MRALAAPAKVVLLGALAFAVAACAGATGLPGSYRLSIAVSVVLCPALLGFVGGRGLDLGAAATLAGINALPLLAALDQRLRLGQPAPVGWLLASFVPAWAGWRLGRRGCQKVD